MAADDVRCFMVANPETGAIYMEFKVEKADRRNFADGVKGVLSGMSAQQSLIVNQTRMGMVYAETDDNLAYIVFVSPSYPERVAKQIVDKHARAVESMASDGTFNTHTPDQSNAAKKGYAAVCKTLAADFEGGDKVAAVMREVDQVKGVMSENINSAMSNLSSAEELQSATEDMKAQSSMFNKQAKTAKKQMWLKNMKLNVIIGMIVLLVFCYATSPWQWFSGDGD